MQRCQDAKEPRFALINPNNVRSVNGAYIVVPDWYDALLAFISGVVFFNAYML